MKLKGFKILILSGLLLFVTSSANAGNMNVVPEDQSKVGYELFKNKSVKVVVNNNDYDDDDKYENNKKDKGKSWKGQKGQKPKFKDDKNKQSKKVVSVQSVMLNKTSTSIVVGSWERLIATVKPDNATNKGVLWYSSNPKVAWVNPSGKVTAVKPGSVVIYAITYDGLKIASCKIKVVAGNTLVPVTEITLNKTTLSLNIGAHERLSATVNPSDASNKTVTWRSSDTGIATVDQTGDVVGVREGVALITAKSVDGNKTANCVVVVTNSGIVPVTSVSIAKISSNIVVQGGASKVLTATLLPNNATNKALNWSSSNTSAVVVNQAGTITGVAEGTAVITVTADGGKTDSCTVQVVGANRWTSVTGVSINLLNTTIPVGMVEHLKYRLEPSNASDQEVKWSSGNPEVASVNALGVVEAKSQGTTLIKVTTIDGTKIAECLVTVVPAVERPANGIVVNKILSTMVIGSTDYPTVTVYPANGSGSSLVWTSSNTSVATVSQTGQVTGVTAGSAVISVKTPDNKTANYIVIVVPRNN